MHSLLEIQLVRGNGIHCVMYACLFAFLSIQLFAVETYQSQWWYYRC